MTEFKTDREQLFASELKKAVPRSQNGWTVLPTVDDCKQWTVPDFSTRLPLRFGPAGLVLVHIAHWFNDKIEPLAEPMGDDFGWSPRKIAGSNEWSNHASGTAIDLNASLHPQGKRDTFSEAKSARIRERLSQPMFGGVVKWGGDYRSIVDEMHFEIVGSVAQVRAVAETLRATPRGIAILKANRGVA